MERKPRLGAGLSVEEGLEERSLLQLAEAVGDIEELAVGVAPRVVAAAPPLAETVLPAVVEEAHFHILKALLFETALDGMCSVPRSCIDSPAHLPLVGARVQEGLTAATEKGGRYVVANQQKHLASVEAEVVWRRCLERESVLGSLA